MNRIFFLLSILFFFSLSSGKSQEVSCGFDQKLNKLLSDHPELRAELDARNKRLRAIMENEALTRVLPPSYEIPVVVHVLYITNGGSGSTVVGNISDAQINSAIDNLNDTYNGLGSSPNVEIQFCLASQDPDCGATTGINRVNLTNYTANGDNYSTLGITNNNEGSVKNQSRWPANQYYNIWVVTEIAGNNGGAGVQGYAYFPGLGAATLDGTVLLYNAFGYDPGGANNYDLKSYTQTNETIIHEIGHALNLYHTFEDGGNSTTCASNVPANCATTGDLICDTEPHLNPNSVCFNGGQTNTCTGAPYGNVIYNFMNYSSDACSDRFTADQVARMRAVMVDNIYFDGMFITTGRASLNVSEGCSTPVTVNSTSGYCSDETNAGNLGAQIGTVSVAIGSINAMSATPEFDNDYYGATHITHCESSLHTEGQSVSVVLDVEAVSDNFVHAKVYIDYNNDGDFADASPNEEVLLLNGTNSDNGVLSGNFTTPTKTSFPALVINTPLKIRVVSDFTGFTTGNSISPCSVIYGQMEDFNITITGTLPVNLLSYEATLKEEKAVLQWMISEEVNHDYYKIERSLDAVHFQHLASVNKGSTDGAILKYQYEDHHLKAGVNYYRLSQYDLDGTQKILGVRAVQYRNEEILFTVYPNPLQGDFLHLKIGENIAPLDFTLYDISGKLLKEFNSEAVTNGRFPLNDLQPGIYILRGGNNIQMTQTKFIKL